MVDSPDADSSFPPKDSDRLLAIGFTGRDAWVFSSQRPAAILSLNRPPGGHTNLSSGQPLTCPFNKPTATRAGSWSELFKQPKLPPIFEDKKGKAAARQSLPSIRKALNLSAVAPDLAGQLQLKHMETLHQTKHFGAEGSSRAPVPSLITTRQDLYFHNVVAHFMVSFHSISLTAV